MPKVVITPRSFCEAGDGPQRLIRDAGYEIVENTTGKTLTESQMAELCADAVGLLVGIDPVSRRVLEDAPNLRAISKYGAGLDNVDLDAAKQLGIAVDRAAGTNAESVAELAVGLMFALARNLLPAAINTKSGGWARARGVELKGKTAGILGLGSIGRETARMARGLGMDVVGYDPMVTGGEAFVRELGIALKSRDEVIREAHFLSLHLPLLDDTRLLINRDTLGMMRPGAYLVNTSRGELVDEAALLEALRSGHLAGAASDVFSQEPPGQHPLLALDTFILTPHIGAYTSEANRRMAKVAAENLVRMLG